MLLIVSTVFVCLNLPSYIVRVKIYLEVSGMYALDENFASLG